MGTALQRLETGGLVTSAADGFGLDTSVFTRVARTAAPPQKTEDYGYADEQTESVVRTFVRDGRLLRLPAQRSRRCMVLKHVVQAFEPGVRYTEKEVDAVLRTWCAVDHVSLRRFLVDEGLVTREAGQYWRSGGWVDVLGG